MSTRNMQKKEENRKIFCNQTIIIPGTFPRPARCQGQLYTYGTGPDEVTKCQECGSVWSHDSKEETPC
jgi:hypothetical protein